jgi:hypothetical protein
LFPDNHFAASKIFTQIFSGNAETDGKFYSKVGISPFERQKVSNISPPACRTGRYISVLDLYHGGIWTRKRKGARVSGLEVANTSRC